ncbi:uncharacterized protein LOC143235742 [Tachypleus tridentatus]|uniref:uncharacterized protein LOC143235742 n=1 Tax=Tachypleus tridentatus TaxID=6853 RepID=UPI003FD2CA8E
MTQGWMLLTLFLLYHDVKDVRPESNVGCFFNPRLCDQQEICYDDNAFGRCQAGYDNGGDTYRHNLTPDTLRLLEQEMKRLFNGGYRWSNDYTQCTMQNILYTDRHNLMYDPGLCSRVLKLTLPAVPSHVAEELEHVNPQDLAYISFDPSKTDTYSDYADETYIPPIEEPRFKNVYAFDSNEDVTYQGNKDKRNNQLPDSGGNIFSELESEIFLEYLRELLQAAGETLREEENNLENSKQEPPASQVDLLSTLKEKPIFTEGGTEWVSVEEPDIQEEPEEQLSSLLMTNPDIWKKETADKNPIFINHLNELIEKERNNKDRWQSLQGDNLINDILSPPDGSTTLNEDENMWVKNAKFLKHLNTVSELGEHINAVDNGNPEIEQDPVEKFKDEFERPMRYDAKKPGPAYYVHEPDSSETGNRNDIVIPSDIMKALRIGGENSFPSLTSGVATGQHPPFSHYAVENELALKQLVTKSLSNPHLSSVSMTTDIKPEEFVFRDESEVVKTSEVDKNETNEPLAEVLPYPISTTVSTPSGHLKPVIADAIGNGGGQYEAVDSSLAYLLMDSTLTMEEGSHLAKRLEKLLNLPRGTFSNVRVKKKQVIFKVNPNPKGLNASTVARKAVAQRHVSADLQRKKPSFIPRDGGEHREPIG